MLSVQELESLNDSDVGRTFTGPDGIVGTVRIEEHPIRRIVVDFHCTHNVEGQPRRLGTWPDQSLAAMRSRALHHEVNGPPPAPGRPQRVAVAALRSVQSSSHVSVPVRPATSVQVDSGTTFAEAFDAWCGARLLGRKDAGESVVRSMRKDVLPYLGDQALGGIDAAQVLAVLNRIVERGSVRQAGCVLSDVRQLFRWALKEGWISDDPTATLSKVALCGAQQPRERHLSHDEVKELAQRMGSAGLARHIRRATWLMLATGARIGEIATARWRDIDVAARLWTIPAQFSHSGHDHVVPLSDFALTHLQPDGGARQGSDWVFPGRNGTEPLSPKALGKQIRDRQRGTQIRGRSAATRELLLSGGAWTPLDLRRTTAAMMQELRIDPQTIAACLDQNIRSSSGHDEAPANETLDRCRDAFDQLGQWLASIERPQSVAQQLAA